LFTAAIDIAERIVLPSELAHLDLPGSEGGPVAGLELTGTQWQISSLSTPPAPGTGPPRRGVLVDSSPIGVSFDETTVTWDDGCAQVRADYELDRDDGLLALTNLTSNHPDCTPPTSRPVARAWRAIDEVIGAGRIPVSYYLDLTPGEPTLTGLLRLGDHDGDHPESADGASMLLSPA
jgi:hypothetical protein